MATLQLVCPQCRRNVTIRFRLRPRTCICPSCKVAIPVSEDDKVTAAQTPVAGAKARHPPSESTATVMSSSSCLLCGEEKRSLHKLPVFSLAVNGEEVWHSSTGMTLFRHSRDFTVGIPNVCVSICRHCAEHMLRTPSFLWLCAAGPILAGSLVPLGFLLGETIHPTPERPWAIRWALQSLPFLLLGLSLVVVPWVRCRRLTKRSLSDSNVFTTLDSYWHFTPPYVHYPWPLKKRFELLFGKRIVRIPAVEQEIMRAISTAASHAKMAHGGQLDGAVLRGVRITWPGASFDMKN